MKFLTSNKLKIIAIIIMIIDHIGYYFHNYMCYETYATFRFIGRISMPLFAFLIVQGFFHTSNLKKYIFRIFSVATIFQFLLLLLGVINIEYFKNYYIGNNEYLNILYSFTICLIVIYLLDNKILFKKLNGILNILFRSFGIIAILSIYYFVHIELGYRAVIVIIGFYISEKIKKILENDVKNKEWIYLISLITVLLISVNFGDYNMMFNLPSLISIIPIFMYNGNKGKNTKFLKNIFYAIYPIHHVILYIIAMCISKYN